MKIRAAILREINKPLQVEELNLPELKKGQVLVKIAFSSVCHSQLNEIRGLKGKDRFLPHTLGHEGSGIVEEIGPGVNKVKPGDHVVLTWIKGKGLDSPATAYVKEDSSLVNSGAISTFLTKGVISENRLVKIPDKMPLLEAALMGCAIPTGAGVVFNTINVSAGDSIAIFGIGGVGLSALVGAKLSDAAVIIAIDISKHKLEQAIKFGATHTIDANRRDVLSDIMEITGGCGVDYAVEAAGKGESMEIAFKAVREKGGLCVIAGNLPQNEKISIDPFDLIKGKQIIGTWGGETQPDRDIPRYVRLYLSGKLKLDKMITNRFKLDEINDALNLLEKGEVIRPIIECS